jgi:steroid 5-alpha reductase family enzyme
MFELNVYFLCLQSLLTFGLIGWVISLIRKNVTHVDSMWSLFFLLAAVTSAVTIPVMSIRATIVLSLVTTWALRLFAYLTWRNWGPHEDSRYVLIRQNNQPHFWLKSIYIIFGLQVMLAWIIASSLIASITNSSNLNLLDTPSIVLIIIGILWETIADWQLTRFKLNLNNKGKVLDTGLWHYSRHPNYFGECLVWWGFYGLALATGAWWTIFSPLIMTLLLLKVSGVSLLESTIIDRRPAYADYIKNTNAFLPSFTKRR